MNPPLMSEDLIFLLEQKEFVHLATCTPAGHPHVVPKFLIKAEDPFVYLADFVMGDTYKNLKTNPRISFSIAQLETLARYQINGAAEILEEGPEFQELLRELRQRTLRFSAERIIRGIQLGKKHRHFEINFPEELAVLKITIQQITHLSPNAHLDKKTRQESCS